jgi:tetratricopeptide (TPR) repeat protein
MNSQLQIMLHQAFEYIRQANFNQAKPLLAYILKMQPKNFDVLHAMGFISGIENNHSEAVYFSLKALKIKPDDLEVNINCAKALQELGKNLDSVKYHQKAIFLSPNNYEIWLGCGKSLQSLKRYDEAIAHYDKALSLKPDFAEAWSNKGNALNELRRYDEAIIHFDQALSLRPNFAEAWSNKGMSLYELKQYDEAIAHYDKALSLKPDYHDASWNKGLSLLIQGDFQNGFPLYESRWGSERVSEIAGKRFFDRPTWLGAESIKGKTILLYGEQGLGDFIQFCRYVKLVADLGAKVILEVPQSLAGLMKGLDGFSQLVIKGEELPFFDYQCPLLSLPLAFRTSPATIPLNVPYLFADASRATDWSLRLGPKSKPRVGLVWSGNPHHKNDHNRSLLLADILPYLSSKFEYVSLQKDVREVDKLTLDSNPQILCFASNLNDFVDTATLIHSLDLVISVDTSVAHLCGALGKKVLVLLPYAPDWRWLLDRADSPWYPLMKLYRQPTVGNWSSVLEKVRSDLNKV